MLSAVQAHENVHAAHFQPAMEQVAGSVESAVEAICVPSMNVTQSQAGVMIQNSSALSAAASTGLSDWASQYFGLAAGDHSGPTDAAERSVVDPMIMAICAYAQAQGWAGSMPCP